MSSGFFGPDTLAPATVSGRVNSRAAQATYRKASLYPNPFLDIAQTYLPQTTKGLFYWCRYYALTNPLVATVLYKKASYSVTDVIYEEANEGAREQWRRLYEDVFRIRSFLVEHNLDKCAYGNAFISVYFPMRKMLGCKSCKHEVRVDRIAYRFKNYEFHTTCPKCGHEGPTKVRDQYIKSPDEIRLVRWNPENIKIQYCEETGERTYFYEMSKQTRNDITLGRPYVIEKLPQEYIEAVRKNQQIRFKPGWVYHSRRPTVSGRDAAWGQPLLAQVLKQVFYLQVLQKAQESILFGHIIPMRVLYPAPNGEQSPYSMLNLASWKDKVNDEIRAFRSDSNYIPVLPVPIGYQNIGGEGKALMLANEIRVWSELVVAGLGWPVEFYFSGISYSGSNVSLRVLENELIGDREDMLHLLQWTNHRISAFLGWKRIPIKMRAFKMADDLQRAAFQLQLVQQKLGSVETLFEQIDLDYDKEVRRVKEELADSQPRERQMAEYAADTTGRTQVIQARYQAKVQEIMTAAQMAAQQAAMGQQGMDPNADPNAQQGPGAPPPEQGSTRPSIGGPDGIVGMSSSLTEGGVQAGMNGGGDLESSADMFASRIRGMAPDQQSRATAALKAMQPQLYQLVAQRLTSPVAADPLPEQRAPRRGPGSAIV